MFSLGIQASSLLSLSDFDLGAFFSVLMFQYVYSH